MEIFTKLFRIKSITWHLLAVIGGSILFRIILAFALSIGIDALYLSPVEKYGFTCEEKSGSNSFYQLKNRTA